ncbi:MAG: asparagine synthase-related protein [Bacteroidia bacterium]
MQLVLAKEKMWRWHRSDGLAVKGFAFDPDGNFMQNGDLHNWLLSKIFNKEFNVNELIQLFKNLNGFFSIVIKKDNKFFIVSDKIRSFPLFYKMNSGEAFITDDSLSIFPERPVYIQPHIRHQFEQRGFVSGPDTLNDEIKQVVAGCFVEIEESSNAVQEHVYFRHLHGPYFPEVKQELMERLEVTGQAIFERLVKSAAGRPIAVPLSGGYDSRFIAAMLRKLKYEPVVCYTYGRENSFEARRAKRVAEQLGFPWFFVKYTGEAFQPLFGKVGAAYREFAADAASLPHEQDFFALYELQHREHFPKEAIIVPGYSGDVLAGSFIPDPYRLKQWQLTSESLADFIAAEHFNLRPGDIHYKETLAQLLRELEPFSIHDEEGFQSVLEHWITVNRQAKYTVNANRVSEFFGYEWRMPLWDDAWMQLWYRIPESQRVGQKLYREFLDDRVFAPMGVRIAGKTFDERLGHKRLISYLKAQLPRSTRKLLKPLFVPGRVADPNNFGLLAKMIQSRLQSSLKPGSRQDLNFVHALWHLEALEEHFKKSQ